MKTSGGKELSIEKAINVTGTLVIGIELDIPSVLYGEGYDDNDIAIFADELGVELNNVGMPYDHTPSTKRDVLKQAGKLLSLAVEADKEMNIGLSLIKEGLNIFEIEDMKKFLCIDF